ncbi:MAG: hypothetical protein KAS49_02095, partial [Candidatus Cloacimonetes bacterium]|nr:hypothetical protein [Candidatus Cloacimonadota bacterium]
MKASADAILRVHGSKSIINRILIICTFLDKPIKLTNFSNCSDVETFVENLMIFGFRFEFAEDDVIIYPHKIGSENLYIKDAGTTFRFLLTRLATAEGSKNIIQISEQLHARPHSQLIDIIKQLGGSISDDFPLIIKGKKLQGGRIKIIGKTSSQFVSSILLSAPNFKNGICLELSDEAVSVDYIKLTLSIMHDFGINFTWKGNIIDIPAGQNYQNILEYDVEPDYSTVCYYWALAAISNKTLITAGNPRKSYQADAKFIGILEEIGAKIDLDEEAVTI